MAGIVKCPTCGSKNPADEEFCQFCQSRLQPLTGPLKGLDKSIKPGDIPTKKDTGQLEPILPEWLRDARSSAKQNSEEDALQAAQQPQAASSGVDLLAGLRSQAQDNEEEDVPDWLTSITGAAPKSKKSQPESPDVHRVELGAKDDFAHDESAPEPLPWGSSAPQSTDKDELTDWFQNATNTPQTQQPVVQPFAFEDSSFSTPTADETPEWLKGIAAEKGPNKDSKLQPDSGNIFNPPSSSSETPDWLQSIPAAGEVPGVDPVSFSEAGFGQAEASRDASAADVPDWLKDFESEAPAVASSNAASDQAWLKDLQTAGPSQPTTQSETPAWLKSNTSTEETESPPWLSAEAPVSKSVNPEQKQSPAPFEEDELSLGDVPSWLKAAAPQSSIFGESQVEQKVSAPLPPSSDTPDWLNAFKSDDAPGSQAVPAFINDSEAGENSGALFTDMPDWLSSANDSSSSSPVSTPPTNSDVLAQSELPSWVQAMRPVDNGISQPSSRSYSSDQTLESRGALAGLQGVLPAVPGFMATSKPKAYSIKLQASEEQQAHADLLEQILSAETEPVPLTSFSVLATSSILRWALAFVVVASLVIVLLLHTQIFSMPNGAFVPQEIGGALRVAQSIPDGAPVLVVFDYEPARAGEMESAAAPMFDQMLLLHHPRLTFISINNTGSILTERFISGPLAGYNLRSGVEYVNLGYLPGGQMGIRAFTQNPLSTASFTFAQKSALEPIPAWTLPPLAGVTSLLQFSAFIIVTDNADSARAWIEQTTFTQGTIPLVVISSAQAAPMIEPYFASKQVTGLVSGLYGSAVFEQNNAGRPGTARIYWDAYSIGMLLAMALILVGGLWNLALGLRDRAAAREAK